MLSVMQSRAERRNARLRLVRRWRRIIRDCWSGKHDVYDPQYLRRYPGIRANTRTPCSCWCCTTKRSDHGKTLQELKQDLAECEQLSEALSLSISRPRKFARAGFPHAA
jgi:hypothetical protein